MPGRTSPTVSGPDAAPADARCGALSPLITPGKIVSTSAGSGVSGMGSIATRNSVGTSTVGATGGADGAGIFGGLGRVGGDGTGRLGAMTSAYSRCSPTSIAGVRSFGGFDEPAA